MNEDEKLQKEFEEYCKDNKAIDPLLFLFGFVFSVIIVVSILSC